jgi:hypothetical protein
MLVAQLINDFITRKRPAAICDKCVADGVGLGNKAAHPAQITAALGTSSDFIREPGICSVCKNKKTVIRRV